MKSAVFHYVTGMQFGHETVNSQVNFFVTHFGQGNAAVDGLLNGINEHGVLDETLKMVFQGFLPNLHLRNKDDQKRDDEHFKYEEKIPDHDDPPLFSTSVFPKTLSMILMTSMAW